MVMAYHRVHGIDTRIARIFNTYGPRMRLEDGRGIPAFMSQAPRREDLTVFGDGRAGRRPAGAPARHHEGAHGPGLGAQGAPRRGSDADARRLPPAAGPDLAFW